MSVPESKTAIIAQAPLLQVFPEAARAKLLSRFKEQSFTFGEVIVREGEEARAYFLLLAGRARVFRESGRNGRERPLNVLHPGDEFGEIALLEGGPRSASVRCTSDVTVLRLERDDFQQFFEEYPEFRRFAELHVRHRKLHNFLRELSVFGALPLGVLQEFLSELEPVSFAKDAIIVGEGDAAGPMYLVLEGRAWAYTEQDGARHNLAFYRSGDYFGELSAMRGEVRTASVQAVTDCELLMLRPDALRSFMERYPAFRELMERRAASYRLDEEARVPLDFSRELLPADAGIDKTAMDEGVEETKEGGARRKSRDRFATDDGLFRKRRRSLRRLPFVRQIDEMDCGAACIAMLCRHFGRRVSLARIRQLAHTAYDGTSLKGIVSAASELGLAARAVKITPADLADLPLPAIVHWEGNHWIVLEEVRRGSVRIVDPASGPRRLKRREFAEKWSGYAALFDYTSDFESAPEGKSTWSWALQFVRPFRWTIFQVLLLAVVTSGLQMLLPIFTQVIVDRVLVEADALLLRAIVIAMIAALVFMLLANLLQRFMLSFAAIHIDAAILDHLTRKLLALPMAYFNARRTGDIQRRLAGARQVREFIVQSGIAGALSLIQIAAYLLVMGVYSGKLLAVFLATAPLYVGLMFLSRRILGPLFERLEESYGRYSSHQIDAIRGIEAVKASSAEQSFRDAMLNEFLSLSRTQFRSNFTIMFYESTVQAVGYLSTILFLWVGAQMVMAEELTMGGFVAFNGLVAMAYTPILTVLRLWDDLQQSSVLMDRLNDIFEFEPEQGFDRSHLKPVPSLSGQVAVKDLSFQYGGPGAAKILSGISFDAPPGKTIAIVGRSGSGKTTLVKCLSGLLEATEGAVLYDGLDMKTLNYRALRRHIGTVLQDNYIFNGTILENIAFGETDPDLGRAGRAARIANADGFIGDLPLGYETRIGESGIALSGGQRQRIAIARALYDDPPILIFDEATSALDTESERAIQDNMAAILTGRTAFIIAHRLSTIRGADRILVIERGEIAEQGTHEELMELKGLYFYLCSQQMRA